jgi:hypothetical protein
MGSTTGLLDRPWHQERQWGTRLAQQRGEPGLIEQHLLASRFPEGTDRLSLAPVRKSVTLDTERNELFEVVGFGITEACLPVPHRLP